MAQQPAGRQLDLATVGGLVLCAVGIVGGLLLEGGSLADIAQVTALMIVAFGTAGAVLSSTPMPVVMKALKRAPEIVWQPPDEIPAIVEQLIEFASRARKHGLVALESSLPAIEDRFLSKALQLAIDGTDLRELRDMMDLDMGQMEQDAEAEAKVYEAAGGYAPTIGIIGAVMGLIQVMKHLEDIKEVGHGIAVAFVATVYGVGLANLIMLPAAQKLKARSEDQRRLRELILEGVVSIVEGMNPKLIRLKLEAYTGSSAAPSRSQTPRAA